MVNVLLKKSKERSLERLKKATQDSKTGKVGFVSGKIMADGFIFSFKNLAVLSRYERTIKKSERIPVFSATDFLFNELVNTVFRGRASGDEYWRDIIESGYITDIYMTPGWESSNGAKSEFDSAKKKHLKIHYISS